MNVGSETEDETNEFEAVLRHRLALTAELMPLGSPARFETGTGRRRTGRAGWIASVAASLLFVIGGVFALASRNPGSDDAAATDNSNVGATVIVYAYPNSSDPQLGGEFADLYTDAEDWIPNAAALRLNTRLDSDQSITVEDRKLSLAAAFELAKAVQHRDPGDVIDGMLGLRNSGPADGSTTLTVDDRSTLAFELLTDLIATGRSTPDQVEDIARLLDSLPAVATVINPDGSLSANHRVDTAGLLPPLRDATFTFDPSTGHPIQMRSNIETTYRIDYLSIERRGPGEYTEAETATTSDEGP
jgi:hypothetical protein